MFSGQRFTHEHRWAPTGTIAAFALLLLFAGPLGSPAHAASVTKAVWSGPGTYTNPTSGQVFGQGGSASITVTTSNDTKCVSLNPTWTSDKPTLKSDTAKTTWTFTLTGLPTTGTFSVTVSASPSFNPSGNCTGSTPGNATVTASYIVDDGPPVVTGVGTPAANSFGWRNVTTNIAWSAVDGGSGIASGPTPATDSVAPNTLFDGVTKTSTATDNVGNVGNGSLNVKVDSTPPTISATRSPAPNAFGWNNSNVTVGITCADVLSGINTCTGGGSVVVSTEGTNQSVSGTATDKAGNTNSDGVSGINIDKTKPTLSGGPDPANPPNADGWYNGNVAIVWKANDDRSGIVANPANSTITGEGAGLFATTSVADKAGNSISADSAKVNIDRTTPSTDATAPSGWMSTAQTVTLVPKDALSGVKSTFYKLDGGSDQSGTSVAISGDGTHTLEYWSVDKAGNVEQHKTINVKIDGSAPTISHTQSPIANVNGWNKTNVTVSFICEDATSGIASCTADQVVSTEGKDQTVTGTATDNAGNTATDPASVSIDKTDPKISADADRNPNSNDAANGTGWYDADVTVTFTCSDALSGIDGPNGCPAPKTVGEGYDQSASGTATDAAGNSATAGVDKINVDKTAPSLSGEPKSEPNSKGWYNDDVLIGWTCSDSLSGLNGACPGNSTITGEGNDLVASQTIKDNAGNTKSADSSPAVKIDRTAPNTTASVPAPLESGWYGGAVKVTLTAADSLSLVDKTYYSVDGGLAQSYEGAFDHSLKGTHTITFWSVDNAGNVENKDAAGHSITLKIDDIKPTITGSRLPAANGFGWNNGAVDVSFVCKDDESGIAGCLGNTTLSAETTAAGDFVTGNAVDVAGNTAEDTVGPIKIDLTRPTLSGTPKTVDNMYGWYNGDVTIEWKGLDALSGIDPATVPGDDTITAEGKLLKAGPQTVKDKAGNASEAMYSTAVNIDRTAPTISGKTVNENGTDRSPNGDGWFNSAVRVRFACADALSTIAECSNDEVLTDDGKGLSATGTALDKAGNSTNTTVGNINIDSHAPVSQAAIVCTSKNGYCRGSKATVNFTATDPAPVAGVLTSGVKEIKYQVNTGAWQTGTTVDVPLNGSGQATVKFYAIDKAGNAETISTSTIDHDTIAPDVTFTLDPVKNGFGWNNATTKVHFIATDDVGGSGVDAATITPDVTVSDETAGQIVNGSAEDMAGNLGTASVTVKLDKNKPTITGTPSGTAGSNGWYTSAVTVAFTCADAGTVQSGIAVCENQQVLANGQSVTGKAKDKADNEASTTVGPVKVDTDAPTITLNGVQNGGGYTLGDVPPKTCAATDAVSGVDGGCQMTVTGGLANGVGTFSFTATAKDMAGNEATTRGSYTVRYLVKYDTAFWLQPINDTAHTVSTTTSVFKAGSTVPSKFRLIDANGNTVQTNSPPVWITPVKGSATTAPVEESVYSEPAMSGSLFTWMSGHYQFNWGSPKNGYGYYWRIGVKLDDNTIQAVNIGLR